jgi:nucleotidyltransferase substrate binding protein (TIGR01987 family)
MLFAGRGTTVAFCEKDATGVDVFCFVRTIHNYQISINCVMLPRSKQRFEDFCCALQRLKEFVDKGDLNRFEEPGFIKTFEFVSELAWKTMKDYFEEQGGLERPIQGSKDAVRLAFQRGVIVDSNEWFHLIEDRNLTLHTYHEEVARNISQNIRDKYYSLFEQLAKKLSMYYEQEENDDSSNGNTDVRT